MSRPRQSPLQEGSVGAFLAKIRKAKGLSQTDVASLAQWASSYISMLESGCKQILPCNVGRITIAYNLTKYEIEELKGFLNFEFVSVVGTREVELIRQLLLLPMRVRQKIIETIRAYDDFDENSANK